MNGALPSRLVRDSAGLQVEWLWWDGSRHTEPFFEETLRRLRGANSENHRERRPRTPLSGLRESPPGLPLAGLIFHISRCGSTLVAQMLAGAPRNLVVSEPPIFDEVLRLREREPSIAESEHSELLRGTVHALGQPPEDGRAERLFLKLDCWHLFSLPLLQRVFPGVPLLFVFRNPLEVVVSLMRQPSLTLVRDTVTPAQLGLTVAARDALTAEEHAAAILGAFFRAAKDAHRSLAPIAYESLPGSLATALPSAFFTDEERRDMAAVPGSHVKRPTETFAADGAEKRASASPRLTAACERYAAPAYADWLAAISSRP